MSLDALPFNLFDCLFVGVLILGLFRGRKQGMSEELLSLLKWLGIVLICAFAYQPLGQIFSETTSMFSLLSCYLIAYLAAMLVIFIVFALIKKAFGGKLLGSDIFGRAEYYLGMGSGIVRFGCILLAVLALLNARAYDAAEVRAMENFQNTEFGSNYFPTLHSVQATVFEKSLVGPWIHDNLGFLLITPTKPQHKELHQKDYTPLN
jgi:uncharacterized membrane protein required for colicin V production